jgi:hypothetical protein
MDEEGMQNKLLVSSFACPGCAMACASVQENSTCNYSRLSSTGSALKLDAGSH